jgi:hypothetical protein
MKILRTRNSAEPALVLSAVVSTANVSTIADGEWALIAPYGDHPAPDGRYVQRFDREQAEKLVKTWNSITGRAARTFKNLWHKRGARSSVPVWDGHPETDKGRWPVEKLLAEVTEIRTGNAGLEGRLTWNARGLEQRTRGALFPSPLWWHLPPDGTPPMVFPELLESIGLVPTPNISGVPAWTQNATLEGDAPTLARDPQAENQTENCMTPEQLAALRKALGLPESADAALIISTANTAHAAVATLAERETALTTANTARQTLETQITTANGQITTLTTERDTLRTANGELTTANTSLVEGVLHLAEARGAITPAERDTFQTRLATANSVATTVAELKERKAVPTSAVTINGNRMDITTANARSTALANAVNARMKADSSDYDTAFAAVKADPQFSGLFAAMADPTRQS